MAQRIETRITAAVLVALVLLCCENNASTVPTASTKREFETKGAAAGKYNANHAPVMSPGHHDVVQALRGDANYTTFAALLDNMTESVIRSGITIFAPTNNALSDFQNMKTEAQLQDVIRFHVVPVAMPFSNLLQLNVGSTLLTEMSNITIQVTNTTPGAYQVDDAVIVKPDLYTDASVAVHGINAVFNVSKISEGEEDTEPTAGGGSPGRGPGRGRPGPSPPRPASPPRSSESPPEGPPIDLPPQPIPSPRTNHAPIRHTFKFPIMVKHVSAYQILMSVIVLCLLKLTMSVV